MEKENIQSTYSSLKIEELTKEAFNRVKTRFIDYFLASILSLLIGTIAFLASTTLGAYLLSLAARSGSVILSTVVGILLFFIIIFVIVYTTSWMTLFVVETLIQDKKIGVIATLTKIIPLTLGYVWYAILVTIFIFGLLPFGILSLSLILILWFLWNSFNVFVYLEKRKRGLDNLWYSRSLVNQCFWEIALRIIFINLIAFAIYTILARSRLPYLWLIIPIVQLFTSAFIISFNYAIYRRLSFPSVTQVPRVWVILSIVGWIINLLLILFLANLLFNALTPSFKKSPSPTRLPVVTPTPMQPVRSI